MGWARAHRLGELGKASSSEHLLALTLADLSCGHGMPRLRPDEQVR